MTITPEQRHVLELLTAAGQRGITEAALSALGCRVDTLANVVRTGLVRLKITEAGRLESANHPPGRSP
jgi:hypothetical protein